MRSTSALFLLVGLATIACDGTSSSSSDKSSVTDRNSDPDDRSARMRGQAAEGSANGTVEVSIAATGQVVGEGDIDAAGRFIADVAADMEGLVVRAYDASGQLRGELLVAASGRAESTTSTAPMSSETRLEAEVFVAAHAGGDGEGPDLAVADLRGRIDAELAATIDAADDREQEVRALARAMVAAQAAELHALAHFGGEAGAEFEPSRSVSVEMMAEVDAALDAGLDAEEADRWFLELEEDAADAEGIGLDVMAEAEASAGLALRMTLDGLVEAGMAADATADEGARRAGELEARVAAEASVWLASSAEFSVEVVAMTEAAADELESDAREASDRDAAVEAWTDFEANLVGELEGGLSESAVVVELMSSVDATLTTEIAAAVEATMVASEALVVGIDTLQESWEPDMEPEAVAAAVVDLRASFHAAAVSDGLSSEARAAAELSMLAAGGFGGGDRS